MWLFWTWLFVAVWFWGFLSGVNSSNWNHRAWNLVASIIWPITLTFNIYLAWQEVRREKVENRP